MFMKFNPRLLLATFLLTTITVGQTTGSATSDKTAKEYMDLMRKDIRREKSSIVDQAMALDSAQKAKFYPIYQKYEQDLASTWDKRINIVKKYAEHYPNVSDDVADQLVVSTQALQAERSG